MIDLMTPVREVMTSKLITVNEQSSISDVKKIFESNRIHHLPVVDNQTLVGILSMTDYLHFLKDNKEENSVLDIHTVSEIMTKGIAVLEPSERVAVALKIFKENIFHAIPVVENNQLKGIITPQDIIIALLAKEDVLS